MRSKNFVLLNRFSAQGKAFLGGSKEQVLIFLKKFKNFENVNDWEIVTTEEVENSTEWAKERADRGAERIVMAGGDGTFSSVTAGIFESTRASEVKLACIPLGSGNDFCKSLFGYTKRSKEELFEYAEQVLSQGKPSGIDFSEVKSENESKYFLNILSFGFPGKVVERVLKPDSSASKIGFGRRSGAYVIESLLGFFDYKPESYRVVVDGKSIYEGPVFSGFILNGRFNGGGMCWSDSAKLDDGLLNGLILKPSSFLNSLTHFLPMQSGDWSEVKDAIQFSGKKIKIERLVKAANHWCELDGENSISKESMQIEVAIKPKSLTFFR